jgi:ABC-type metal ion transport system substrate-binding protein
MAGAVGAGGLGDVAIRYGYQRFETDIMVAVIVVLIGLVSAIQLVGDFVARRADRRASSSFNDHRTIMKTSAWILGPAAAVLFWAGALAAAPDHIKVGVSGGDGELIWSKVKEVAQRRGLDVEVVVFDDYLLPNAAPDAGDLDANAFQHRPFLENQIRTRGYHIVAIADTIVEPIRLYSLKVKSVAALTDGAAIGIPNDPSNGGRGLLLLAAQGLIKLRDGVGILPSLRDGTANPRHLKIRELDARPSCRAVCRISMPP